MNKISLFLFLMIGIAVAAGSACKDENKYKKEMAQLDSLKSALKISDSVKYDSVSVNERISSVNKDLSQMDTLLPDTLNDKELAILLMDYRSAIMPLKQYPGKLKELKNISAAAQKRMDDLESDLEKDIADEKEVSNYINAEKVNAGNIVRSIAVLELIRDSAEKKIAGEKEVISGKIEELSILKKEKKKKH